MKGDYVYFYIVWLPGYPKTGGGPGLVCGPPFVDSWLVLPITVGPHLKPRSNRVQNPSFPIRGGLLKKWGPGCAFSLLQWLFSPKITED